MIDWEGIIDAGSMDELKDAKIWLFRENMRLERERMDLEKEQADLKDSVDKFRKERVQFKSEMEELNRRTIQERKMLHQENLFFDKKMAILKDGFKHLEEDRKAVEREKKALADERRLLSERGSTSDEINAAEIGTLLFRSAAGPLGIRKRYKDLIKIFHPDNLFGDDELSQIINREFQKRKREEF